MFAKLLKHEWRATRGLLGWLTLAVLGLGVFGIVAVRLLGTIEADQIQATPALSMLVIGLSVALILGMLGLAVYAVAVQFILLYRFYKNKFTDEGYLTFTLPVKVEQIYWSAVVNILIWTLISTLAVGLVIFAVVALGTGQLNYIVEEILPIFELIFEEMNLDDGFMILNVLAALVNAAYGMVLPLACVTMGAVLVKKHKILAAFGIGYAVNAAVGVASSVLTTLPTVALINANYYELQSYMNISLGIQTVLTAGLTVGGYFLTIHLMKKKLNLP